MIGRLIAVGFSVLLGMTYSVTAQGTVVLLEGKERGLGFAFCNSTCSIIAPLHLLEGQFDAGASEGFETTGDFGTVWKSYPSKATNAHDEGLDWMVLEGRPSSASRAAGSDRPGADSQILPLSTTSLIFRERSGLLQFVAVDVRGEDVSGHLAIEPQTEHCPIQEGRSGALLVSQNRRIMGMLLEVVEGCIGRVVPVEALNAFLAGYFSLRFPSHTYSTELLQAARCANEEAFFALVSSGADSNAFGDSGHTSVERLVTTYGIGLECRRQGPRRRERNEFSSRREYREYLAVQRQVECREITSRRLRMIDSLSRSPRFRVDGLGGHRWTPLMSAVAAEPRLCNNDQIVEMLLRLGADPNHRAAGYRPEVFSRPLDLAIEDGSSRSVLLLLEAGADPNLRDQHGLNSAMQIVIDPDPSEHIGDQTGSSCWDEIDETHLTKKLEYVVQRVDLAAEVPHDTDDLYGRAFAGLTVKQILLRRLNCEAANEACYAVRRTGAGRCLEKMLSKLPR